MYISIPKDILAYKSKIIGSLSAREVAFGLSAVLLVLIMWFSVLPSAAPDMDTTWKTYVCALCALPLLLIGFVKLYGQPFEKIAMVIVQDQIINPTTRRFRFENTPPMPVRKKNKVAKKCRSLPPIK